MSSALTASLADRYRIERELGQGGMATVYLAADLKHDRKVAIKVLKPELAAVLGAERFVQEIKTTAALSHPHILPLFDSGEAAGFLYYVMPYIEGETIRQKLNRETQFGIEDAVRITTEVADALDYAHRHGVIHRDIKPENILLHDGRPMVMDFGIALAVSAAAGGRMTETGLSLGTPHYMSPEQATADKQITARSDIYSLASVLYEMLTGEPPHSGGSAQAIIMKIVTDVPRPVSELRKSVPPNQAAAIATALEKLPADRFESAKAFAEALANPAFGAGSTPRGTVAVSRRQAWRAWAGWGVAAGLAVVLAWSLFGRRPVPGEPSTQFTLSFDADPASSVVDIDISADGRRIFLPGRDGRLLVRDLGSLQPTVLEGRGNHPAVSPDGRWIAYSREGTAFRVPLEGGAPIPLGGCFSPTWLDSESLVCYSEDNWGLVRVGNVDGGAPRQLTMPDTAAGEIGHWGPHALPGGRAVIFTSYRRPAPRIEALDLETGRRVVVVENAFYARYARSGHLLFVRDSALFAVRFDPKTFRTEGSPVPVLDDVAGQPSNIAAGLAISDNGTLAVLRQSQWWVNSRIVSVDRTGRESAVTAPGSFTQPRFSPDGTRILLTAGRQSRNLWVLDTRRSLLTQLTHNPGSAFYGVWSPDGREIFYTNETPSYDLYRIPADGSKPPTALVSSVHDKNAMSVTPDGRLLAYEQGDGIMVAPINGAGPPRAVGDSTLSLRAAQFSPDGRWLAVAGRSGANAKPHLYLLRSDGTGGARQVTGHEDGEGFPHWTRGGRELVFRRGTAVYAVDVDPATGETGTERLLFRGDYPDVAFDVSPDGNRFLMVKYDNRPEAQPLLVITNFFDELRRKVGR